jgi:hypothetical protein
MSANTTPAPSGAPCSSYRHKIDNSNRDVDSFSVNGAPAEQQNSSRVSKHAIRAMATIVVVLLLVALYANIQKLRRGKIESVKLTPATAASPPAVP